jgi:hypothetical protein
MNAQSAATLLFLAFVLIAALMVWIGRDPDDDIDPSRPEGSWTDEEKETWWKIDSIDLENVEQEATEATEFRSHGPDRGCTPFRHSDPSVSSVDSCSDFQNWGCE